MKCGDRLVRWSTPTLLVLCSAAAAHGSVEGLKRHVDYLASKKLEGRLTGTEGERLAANYLAGELEALGASPLPGTSGFRLSFDFTAGTNDIGSTLSITRDGGAKPELWTGLEQVRALSFSDNGSVTGPVIFAGYGITVPESQDLSYDSYFGLDVKDKIVLVLRYSPEDVEDEMRVELSRYSGLRYKALQARDRGAKALVVITGPNSPNAGKTIDSPFDAALSGSGIIAASVGGDVAARMFDGVEGGLKQKQSDLDTGNPHVRGFEIPGLTLTLDVKIEREQRSGLNVLGYLPPTDEAKDSTETRYVILGAHYDHLGFGKHGNSRANKDETGLVHHGADDNASGVAAVLDIGRQLAGRPRRHGIILAFWTGEELGLLGSTDFVKQGLIPPDRIAAYLNFDMVGRMKDDRLNLQGVGSSSAWPRLIEQTNIVTGLDVRTQSDPYLPTDASVLYQQGVPVVHFFTGSHDDYHRPTDRAETVNYDGLEQVARFASLFTTKLDGLDKPPDYVKVERSLESTGSRDSVRAFTGTIPDYATEVDGLRLSGVIGGGPAEEAGLREGDVIVEFAGRKIANIYDYTYALDAVKVDQPVQVVCLRDGKRMEFTITPTSRP